MKKLILIALLLLQFGSFAQTDFTKKHTISYELGIYSRGLAGIGYNYNFPTKDIFFISLHGSAGVGAGNTAPNIYTTVAPSINLGKKQLFLTVGVEAKYVRIGDIGNDYTDGELQDPEEPFQGFGYGPYIGLNFFSKKNFNLKSRIALTDLVNPVTSRTSAVGAGLSFGYTFGN